MDRRIKNILSYNIGLDKGELISYLFYLTSLWRRSIKSYCNCSHTVNVVRNVNMLHKF